MLALACADLLVSLLHPRADLARHSSQSHWQSQGHGPAHFFPNWFNPLHLEFCDPSNHARVCDFWTGIIASVLVPKMMSVLSVRA